MITVYVASNESYAGKTLTCMVLGKRWRAQGKAVGYFKPIGLAGGPGEMVDEDARFLAAQLGLSTPPSQLCPVLLGPEYCEHDGGAWTRIREAFAAASAGKDVMIVGGSGPVLTRGALVGLAGPKMTEVLDAWALLVARFTEFADVDSILEAQRQLGARLLGTIINRVPSNQLELAREQVAPCLEREGARVFGVVPDDPILHSVSVREIAEQTGAKFLAVEEAAEELVEHFVVGAMTVESALRYFRRTPRKCVITGGDRGDIQLAALETPTKCLLLTGDLRPSQAVLNRVAELSIPVLLVKRDTLSTVTTIESMLGAMRLREPKKAQRAMDHYERHVQLDAVDAALGLK